MDLLVIAPLAFALLQGLMHVVAGPKAPHVTIALAAAVGYLAASVGLLFVAIAAPWPTALHLGGWQATFGIVLVADTLPACLTVATALVYLASIGAMLAQQETGPTIQRRLALLSFLLAGVSLAFVTGDLFNLYVSFELLLLASYGLVAAEAPRQDLRHSWTYFLLNALGSLLFLGLCGVVYGVYGTLNFAELSGRHLDLAASGLLAPLLLPLAAVAVFALKAGVFPLYFWLPRIYPALPIPLACFFYGVLTKVGIYAILRTLAVFPVGVAAGEAVLIVGGLVASVTMLVGGWGALAQGSIRAILALHIVSQIGYLLLGAVLQTQAGVAATTFYLVHIMVVKSALVLAGGAVLLLNRSDAMDETGNLWAQRPVVGVVFLLGALSLAGLPPFSGFWAKVWLLQACIAHGSPWALGFAGVALAASVLTLLSMLKIWLNCFWTNRPEVPVEAKTVGWRGQTFWGASLVGVSVALGIFLEPAAQLAEKAARQWIDPSSYRASVLLEPTAKPTTPDPRTTP